MNRRGVCYDVGRVLEGSLQRVVFDPNETRRELEIIRDDLHCNAVRIQGLDLDRLVAASEDALKLGLEVWFSPEMFEKSQDETLEYLQRAAVAAESLRARWPNIVFSLGSELTLFMQGIAEGSNLMQRMNRTSFWEDVRSGKYIKPLNDFLAKANAAVRSAFHGKVTYFSVPFERVDWSILDFVGVDLYRDARTMDTFGRMPRLYAAVGKPVLIGEFGCCTFQGAEKLGGMGWALMFGMAADYLGAKLTLPPAISEIIKIPARVDGHYIRDEALQARELSDQLAELDKSGVEGAFVFTFVSPTSPYNPDGRFDSDMGSYSLVKSYPQREAIDYVKSQIATQGNEMLGIELPRDFIDHFAALVGKHGETYPDMTWEPKKSFRSVADYYGRSHVEAK